MYLKVFPPLVKYNLKIIIMQKYFLIALIYSLLLPVFISFGHLNQAGAARISELFFTVLGIIIIIPLMSIERECGILEIVSSKWQSQKVTFIFRFIEGLIILMLFTVLLLLIMRVGKSDFSFIILYTGTIITALYLGTLGMTITSIIGNPVPGFLAVFSYYLFEVFTGGKYTGLLYIFGLSRGDFSGKPYLLLISTFLLVINLFLVDR